VSTRLGLAPPLILACLVFGACRSPVDPAQRAALALIAPLQVGDEVAEGWTLAGLEVHSEYHRYEVQHPGEGDPCQVTLELSRRRPDHPGLVPLQHYSLQPLRDGCGGFPDELVQAFAVPLTRNEELHPRALLVAAGDRDLPTWAPERSRSLRGVPWTSWAWLACLAFGVGAALVSVIRLRRVVWPATAVEVARTWRWLAPIPVLVAGLTRGLDTPWTVGNVNSHAWDAIAAALIGPVSGPSGYGQGSAELFHLLFAAGAPPVGESIMAANVVLGVLSVAALQGLVLALLHDRLAAWLAALLWALLPAHVRLCATEDFPALLSLLQIGGSLAVVVAARSGRVLPLLGGAALLLFGVRVRPESWLLVPGAALLFAVVCGRARVGALARSPRAWLVAAGIAAAFAVPAWSLLEWMAAEEGAHRSIQPLLWRPLGGADGIGQLAINPRYTSPLLGIGVLLGVAVAGRRRWPIAAALLALYTAHALTTAGCQLGVLPTARLQVTGLWPLAALAGLGWAGAVVWVQERQRWLAAALAVTVLAACYLPYRGWLRERYVAQHEYAFQRQAFTAIPDRCVLVTRDRHTDDLNTGVAVWLPAAQGRTLYVEDASSFLARGGAAAGECAVYYRGSSCFAFPRGDTGDQAMQPLCARMDAFPVAEILAQREIAADDADMFRYREERLTLQLRRLESGEAPAVPGR